MAGSSSHPRPSGLRFAPLILLPFLAACGEPQSRRAATSAVSDAQDAVRQRGRELEAALIRLAEAQAGLEYMVSKERADTDELGAK